MKALLILAIAAVLAVTWYRYWSSDKIDPNDAMAAGLFGLLGLGVIGLGTVVALVVAS